jgi:hypothetical protein
MVAMVKSSNGQTWSAKQGPLPADTAFDPSQLRRVPSAPDLGLTVAKNGPTMVIGGGTGGASLSSLVVTADNGSTWKFGYDGNSSDANGATEYFTVDGVSSSGGSSPNPAPHYQHVAYANGKFVGLLLNQSFRVSNAATSTNGLNWVTHAGVFGQASVFPLALGSTGSEFVLMTGSGVFTSSNGQSWNQIPDANLGVGAQQSSSMRAVVSGNGVTIMVGTLDSNSVPVAPKVLLNGAAPTVTGVSPSSGSAAGGTAITITGTNFASGATVTVGGAACSNVVVVSPTSITCTTPARTAGTSSVVVTSGGQSNAANSLFTFNALSTTTTTTTAPAAGSALNSAVSRLVNSSNQAALTAAPGKASVLVNGVAVAAQIVTASNSAAAQADPAQRSPEQVRELQQTAATIETRLDTIAGGDSGVSVVRTETGAVLTGIFSGTRVPVEDVVVVNAANTATLFAARDVRGNIVEVKPGAVLEVASNGDVAVQAFGLQAGETVELVVMSTPTLLGTFTVDAKGTIKTTAKLPTTIGSGNHSLVVASPSVKASLGLKLVKSSATLPETGSNTNDFSNWAVAVTLSGIYLMMVARSRRRVMWQ